MHRLDKLAPTAIGSVVSLRGTAVRSVVSLRGTAVRTLRTSEWNVAFVCDDRIWITVELSAAFRVRGEASGARVDRVGAVGGVSINPTGQPLSLAIRGAYRAVQVAVPVRLATAVACEDHGLDDARVEFEPRQGQQDMQLAKLLCSAATRWDDENEEEPLRAVATYLLMHHSTSGPRNVSLSRAGITPGRLRRVQDYVEAHLGTATVAGMAREAGISPFHFAREFKRTTGESPWSFVTRWRLGRAMVLLEDRDLPLGDVARMAGFADASHLTHRMRDRLGCSPTEARRHLLV